MMVLTDAERSNTPPTEKDPRWMSVVARNGSADGTFYYSVATTGVYCFPSCSARLARPENVRFHATRQDAEHVGFRPCKRCKPDRGGTGHTVAEALYVAISGCSLGLVLVARSATGVAAVLLGDDRAELHRDLERRFPSATLIEGGTAIEALAGQVIELVESRSGHLTVPLDLRGTEFQRTVWQALRQIPAGSTASYTDLARRLGRPTAARAVARACAANPLAVVVPCHRVITSRGTLSGYRWGVDRKRALLAREAVLTEQRPRMQQEGSTGITAISGIERGRPSAAP